MNRKPFVIPFVLPVAAFAAAIFIGAFLLNLELFAVNEPVPYVDALFIATSCVCVTGLATVDAYSVFNEGGRVVMLLLMQLGGLGIVTYSTLILYMVSRRISLLDRLAVGQALLHDSSFDLGRFLQRMLVSVLCIEAVGAIALYVQEPEEIGLFNAIFLAVSGFCNAGFAPWADNLVRWQKDWGINITIMSLIVCGGIGFFVIDELARITKQKFQNYICTLKQKGRAKEPQRYAAPEDRLSYHSRVVIYSTAGLIVFGALAVFLADIGNAAWGGLSFSDRVLASLFQSVTSRTAGFATRDMATFSDVALMVTILLMFIGGSPGSCAGGIKTTSFRVLCSYIAAELRGHKQVNVAGRAVSRATLNKTMLLFYFALLTVLAATFLLVVTENGGTHYGGGKFTIIDLLFEVVSAFGTVGLSINVSPSLSTAGKLIVCMVMFIGRLGPIWLLTTIQQFQSEPAYSLPEEDLPIG